MADISNIEMRNGSIIISLDVSKDEYDVLKNETKDLMIIPTNQDIFSDELTTGTLGNSNRIMLPNKILKTHEIKSLHKKVPFAIFEIKEDKYLVIELQKKRVGIPRFEDGQDKK
jgi:hypothetical protein